MVELLDGLDFRERSELLFVIAEALFLGLWGRIGSIESIRSAGNTSCVVGIDNGEAHTKNIFEISRGGLVRFKTRSEVDMTIT